MFTSFSSPSVPRTTPKSPRLQWRTSGAMPRGISWKGPVWTCLRLRHCAVRSGNVLKQLFKVVLFILAFLSRQSQFVMYTIACLLKLDHGKRICWVEISATPFPLSVGSRMGFLCFISHNQLPLFGVP